MDHQIFPYTLRSGVATWRLAGTLDVSIASALCESAKELGVNPKVKRVKIEVEPGSRLGLAGYQVLKSLAINFEANGKVVDWTTDDGPFGGRAW